MTITRPLVESGESFDIQPVVDGLCTVHQLQQQPTMIVALVTPLQATATIFPLLQARAQALAQARAQGFTDGSTDGSA